MTKLTNVDFIKLNNFRKRGADGSFEYGNAENNYLDEPNDEYLIGYKFENDKVKEFKVLITDLLSDIKPSNPSEPTDPTDPTNPTDPTDPIPAGKYIVDITGPVVSENSEIYTVVYSDESTKIITISGSTEASGSSGEGNVILMDGKSIVNITGPVSNGLVDTYTINYTDNTTSTFTVTNGRDGSGGEGGSSVQSDWNQSDSEAADFVKNRTHYVESFNCDPWLDADVEEGNEDMEGMFVLNNCVPYPGCNVAKVTLTIDENEHVFFCQPGIDHEGPMTDIEFEGNDYSVEIMMVNDVAVIWMGDGNSQVTGHVKIELYDYLYITENGETVAYPSNFAFGSVGEGMDDAGMLTIPLPILENYNDGDIITVKFNSGSNIETYTSSCKHINIEDMPLICIGNPWVYLIQMIGGGEIQSVTDLPEEYQLMYSSMLGPNTGEDWCMLSSTIEGGTVFMKMNTTFQNANIQYFSVARSTVNVYKKLDIQYTQVDWNTDGNDNNSAIINKPVWKESKTTSLGAFNITCHRESSNSFAYYFEGTTHFVFDDNYPVDFFDIYINHGFKFSCVVEWDEQSMSFAGRYNQGSTTGARLSGEYNRALNEITIRIEGNDLSDLNINSESQDCELYININAILALWNDSIAAEINNLDLQTDVNAGLTEMDVQEFGDGSYIHAVLIPNTYHTYMLIEDGMQVSISASILNGGNLNLDIQTIKSLNFGIENASYCGNLNWYYSRLMNIESTSIVDADDPYYSNAAFVFASGMGTSQQCMLVYKGAQDARINRISIQPHFVVSYHKLDSRYLPDTPSSSSSSSFSGDYNDLSNKPNLATVATTGDYDDLTNKPTIPTVPANVSAFTNDAGYLKTLVGDAVIPNAVTDYDGNTYSAVILGDQVWMAQNLRTTHYADGTYIGTQTNGTQISNVQTPSYYTIPNVDLTTYGLLYPWDAVMNGASSSDTNPSGVQGIAPNGWHVPSNAEWMQLIAYMSSVFMYQCGSNSANIAKALAATNGWSGFGGENYPGDQSVIANNATGFSAVPAGRYFNSSFSDVSNYATFWSSSQYEGGTGNAHVYELLAYKTTMLSNYLNKAIAFSVRCLYNGTVEEFLKQWLLANRNYYLRPKVNGFEFVLPPAFNVTAADAGKILMVDANGEYTPITLSELKTQLDALT